MTIKIKTTNLTAKAKINDLPIRTKITNLTAKI